MLGAFSENLFIKSSSVLKFSASIDSSNKWREVENREVVNSLQTRE